MARSTRYGNKNVIISIQPNIGLDSGTRQSVVEMLNFLLADEAVLSLKTHRAGAHTSEKDLTELQSIYTAQYQQIKTISSEMSERIQILGGSPLSGIEKLIDAARLDGNVNGLSDVIRILADQEAFIRFLREDAQKCSEVYEDQGTHALLINILRVHEKMAWMLRSYLGPEFISE